MTGPGFTIFAVRALSSGFSFLSQSRCTFTSQCIVSPPSIVFPAESWFFLLLSDIFMSLYFCFPAPVDPLSFSMPNSPS